MKKKLFYFSADWCNPCKTFGPIITDVCKQNSSLVDLVKINIDYTPDVTAKFGVKNIPTVVLVENDQEVRRFTGAKSGHELTNWLNG